MKRLAIAFMAWFISLSSQAGDWEFSITPYLWLPTIEVLSSDANSGGGIGGDPGDPVEPDDNVRISIGPTDYLEALDLGFMIAGEARKDNLVLKGDLIYLDFSVGSEEVKVENQTRSRNIASYDSTLTAKMPTLLAGLNVIDTDNYHMDVLAGWRRADIDFDLKLDLDLLGRGLIPRIPIGVHLRSDDFIAAINGKYRFADSGFSIPYYADIGTGDSDLTWQVMLGLDYAFDSWTFHLNYRHLEYDFGNVTYTVPITRATERLEDFEVVFSGPTIGAKFEF